MSHEVFISYSSFDKAAADATCAALEGAGIRCWIAPRDIIPGKEWGDAIIEAIHSSRVLVLIFSASANMSPQIRREVERAVDKGLPIIPLRIEDIAPTHSLEYFIGTVHWLDALTPPFENHLRRLADSVKALLQIDPDRPSIVAPAAVALSPRRPAFVRNLVLAAVAVVGVVAVMFLWSRPRSELPSPAPSSSVARREPSPAPTPAPIQATGPAASPETPPAHAPATSPKPPVDLRVVGTLERRGVVNGYSARYAYVIDPGGGYTMTTTLEETGAFKGGNGKYRTISSTGYVRTGAYRAVGPDAIEVISSEGVSAVFTPAETLPPLDPVHPAMLGRWRAVSIQDGVSWTWTVQNGSDGHYVDHGKAEDAGHCAFSDGHWQCVSTVSGHSSTGSYRVTDQGQIEITDEQGSLVWQRLQHAAE